MREISNIEILNRCLKKEKALGKYFYSTLYINYARPI